MPNPETPEPFSARDALFNLAVNRALVYLHNTHAPLKPEDNALHLDLLERHLAPWHARTRFAARLSLRAISEAVAAHPGTGLWHWSGGVDGSWQPGQAATP